MSDLTPYTDEIWNRPARVDAIYNDQATVWWLDNNTRGYVPLAALGEVVTDDD